MRIQIVHLDPYDDTSSARDRLRWAKAERIVLVWPGHGRVLPRRLDLVLLRREARRQGARLGVVVHDPDVRQHARDLNVPVFDDLDSVTADAWPDAEADPPSVSPPHEKRARPVRSDRSWPGGPRQAQDPWRAGWVLFVIAALLALSVAVGPVAVVELTPSIHPQTESLALALTSEDLSEDGLVTIPARRVRTSVEGELRLPTEGRIQAPATSAEGTALFTNRDQVEVVIPEATGLRTASEPSIRFETIERTLVPAGIGSQVEVAIRASAPGPQGNVAAGAIVAVEGLLGLQVSVENPEPTDGGATSETSGVSQADVDRALDALETRLLQEATTEISDSLADGEAIAPQSIQIEDRLTFESRPAVGQPSESVAVRLRLLASALAYDAVRLASWSADAITESAGEDLLVLPESVRIELQPTSRPDQYQAVVRADALRRVDFSDVATRLAAKAPHEAESMLLRELDLQVSPRIRIWPEWWPRLPLLPWRIRPVWISDIP